MRWTRRRCRRTAPTRTAKSCGPDAPTLASSLRMMICKRRWQKSPVTGESTKETVKTIAQGMSECFGVPVVTTLVWLFFIPTRGCGCNGHPAFPAPSVFRGTLFAKLGRDLRRENADLYPPGCLTFESVTPTPSSPAKAGDPVIRGGSDRSEKPRRTGYPACAGYDDRC
jgi:hypothetical protein